MGNTFTRKDDTPPKKISDMLDDIATHYILTMDFKSLNNLQNKEYCDKLVVLTSDIIKRYFTDLEITYLSQRINEGNEVNELKTNEKVMFFNKSDLENMSIDSNNKQRVCTGIAKFYIKIAHIYAAIVKTLNPVYSYKDFEGKPVRVSLYDKDKIPPNTQTEIERLNICDNRLNALSNKWDPKRNNIHPKMCNINLNNNDHTKFLDEEPGIPELSQLYNDDNYDYTTGEFTGMSEETRKIYKNDLKIFYNIFTNNTGEPPDNIKSFKDIKLRAYHDDPNCNGEEDDAPYKKNIENDPENAELFKKYALNMKNMFNKVQRSQEELMKILNDMFLYTINPITKKKQITLKPILNEVLLDKIMTQTRYSIIKLYLNCEKDFTVGLNIYQAIVNKKILETSPNQVITLERERDILATSIQNAEPDVVIEPRVIDNSMVDNRKPIDDGNPLQNLPTPQIGLPTEVKNENVQFETQVKPILVEEKGVQQIV
jgi:hypothetical protein